MKFPFVRPNIPSPTEWVQTLNQAYENKYFTNFGPIETSLSEKLLATFSGEDADVTLACNATAGLTASLIAHRVSGKVIIPNFTFPATMDAVFCAGCEPVLCDVNLSTCELDPASVEEAFSKHNIAAVMPVRAYGFVRNFDEIISLSRLNKVPVIIDAAASLGNYQIKVDRDITEVTSLHATKSFGIGEGGAIFSDRRLRPELMSALNFGIRPDRTFGFGFNGKMTELQASVGLAQLNHIPSLIDGRLSMARWYTSLIQLTFPNVELPQDVGPTAWSNFPIFLPPYIDSAKFQDICHSAGYQVRRYYWPTLSEGYNGRVTKVGNLKNSLALAASAVCLPLYSEVTQYELNDIKEILETTMKEFK